MSERVIDCQAHPLAATREQVFAYMDHAWRERLARANFVLPPGWPHPGSDLGLHDRDVPPTPEAFSAATPDAVEALILLPSQLYPCAGWCDDSMCAVYATALNRLVVEEWLPADPRHRLALGVSPLDPRAAVAEIERLAGDDRVVAVSTSLIAINLGQAHYRPIFEAAHEHGLPVIIHPGGTEGLSVGPPTLGGVGPRLPEERYSLLPQIAEANVASIIYDGTFVQLPELKVVFAGFGFNWARSLLWRADQEWRNLRIDVPWVTEPPTEYAAKHLRLVVDDIGAAPVESQRTIAGDLPESLLLYGSDRPFTAGGPGAVLDAMPDDLRERVAHLNAEDTFPRIAVTAGSGA